jgi:DNA-binding ferritin-like protein (Dps family)
MKLKPEIKTRDLYKLNSYAKKVRKDYRIKRKTISTFLWTRLTILKLLKKVTEKKIQEKNS